MWKGEMKVITIYPGEKPLKDNLVLWEVDEALGERKSTISVRERSFDYCWKHVKGEEHEGSCYYVCDYSWNKDFNFVCEFVEVKFNEPSYQLKRMRIEL